MLKANLNKRVTNSDTYMVATIGGEQYKILHEFCDTTTGFHHRLRHDNRIGEWMSYQGIAMLSIGPRRFCGVTDFFTAGGAVYYFVPGKKI